MINLRRIAVAVLAVAVLGLSACDDGTDPVATATVEVLAYIDANNSNDNDAGDVPIEGATVTLTLVGGDVTLTQSTGPDGVATFQNVEIGSYTGAIEPPASLAGVTLASASAPSVSVDEDGATVSAEFRYTYNPGAISGHVFIGSGSYTSGDPVVPGVTVEVSQAGTVLNTLTTDADGAFTAGGLLPGDYDVAVTVPAYLMTGTTSQTVTVAADGEATADFAMMVNVSSTVAEARAAATDDTVSVLGVAITGVTGDSAALSGSSFYMQDASGISIYLADVDAPVELGDSILVYGVRGAFNDEVQLTALAAIILGEGTIPTPTAVTAADINMNMYQGQLAVIQNVVVDSLPASNESGEVWVSEFTTGEDLALYVDRDAAIDIGATFTVGTAYDVTGVVARYRDLFELKPRMTSDVAAAGTLPTSVQDVRDAAEGTAVTVTGIVTEDGTLEENGFYIQDATAGIFVYTNFGNIPAGLAIGDVVTVSGDRAQFFSIAQIGGTLTINEDRTASTPVPTPVSATELNSGDFQGQLVVMADAVVDSISGSNVYVSDAVDGTDALIRLDSDSGVTSASFTVDSLYTVAGVVSNFGGTEQLKPRFEDDVSGFVAVDTANTIAEARAAAEGAPVDVQGVVTVDDGNFGSEVYIQDGEAGINLFPAADGLLEGDSVRIIGTRGAFNGNVQISVDSTEVLAQGVALPAPVTITGTQLNAGSNPGELVTLASLTVDSVNVINSFDSHVVYGQAGDGQAVQLYVDNRTGIASTDWTVATDYNVTGILTYRDPDWRIQPRKPADVTTN